jgi:hypothetical protein
MAKMRSTMISIVNTATPPATANHSLRPPEILASHSRYSPTGAFAFSSSTGAPAGAALLLDPNRARHQRKLSDNMMSLARASSCG